MGLKVDFTKLSFHYIEKALSNPLNLIQRELLVPDPLTICCFLSTKRIDPDSHKKTNI
jgi:hypothetical protein